MEEASVSVYVYGSNISVFPSFLFISNIASSAMSAVFVVQRVVRYVIVEQGACFSCSAACTCQVQRPGVHDSICTTRVD